MSEPLSRAAIDELVAEINADAEIHGLQPHHSQILRLVESSLRLMDTLAEVTAERDRWQREARLTVQDSVAMCNRRDQHISQLEAIQRQWPSQHDGECDSLRWYDIPAASQTPHPCNCGLDQALHALDGPKGQDRGI